MLGWPFFTETVSDKIDPFPEYGETLHLAISRTKDDVMIVSCFVFENTPILTKLTASEKRKSATRNPSRRVCFLNLS